MNAIVMFILTAVKNIYFKTWFQCMMLIKIKEILLFHKVSDLNN